MPAQAWVTLIIGLVATVGVLITWRQKNTADRRSEWWRRTTWAFERTFSTEDTQAELGLPPGWGFYGSMSARASLISNSKCSGSVGDGAKSKCT